MPFIHSSMGWRLLRLNVLLSQCKWNHGAISPAQSTFLMFRSCFFTRPSEDALQSYLDELLQLWMSVLPFPWHSQYVTLHLCQHTEFLKSCSAGLLLGRCLKILTAKLLGGKRKTGRIRKFTNVHCFLSEVIYWWSISYFILCVCTNENLVFIFRSCIDVL